MNKFAPSILAYNDYEDSQRQYDRRHWISVVRRRLGLGKALKALTPCDPVLENRLNELMKRYRTDRLVNITPEQFEAHVKGEIGRVNYEIEGYSADEINRQRDLSIKFHWGHNHDFGSFHVNGLMGDRHILMLKNFIKLFQLKEDNFEDKDILDVGCWTGGTTLILSALGARVVSIEEIKKYARVVRFLANSFGIDVAIIESTLYNTDFQEKFDIVYFPGVVYHLSDPVLALRILYNSLRLNGEILIESAGVNIPGSVCNYEGCAVFNRGNQGELSRGGWNWFVPSPLALARMLWAAGFQAIRIAWADNRLYAHGVKTQKIAITRAGLSRWDIP